ncbi:MAG: hypothetical protein UY82_C0049G0015, partial [Candidatus Uhrbacteria bacterium GW2011_GWC2_53_7]
RHEQGSETKAGKERQQRSGKGNKRYNYLFHSADNIQPGTG